MVCSQVFPRFEAFPVRSLAVERACPEWPLVRLNSLTDLETSLRNISGLDSSTLSKHDYVDTTASLPFLI